MLHRPFLFFLTLLERTFFSVSSLFFSIYLKERQLSIRIGSFPAVCPSGTVSRGTNKRGDSLLTWTRAFLGGPKIQFSMESGVRQTDDMQGRADTWVLKTRQMEKKYPSFFSSHVQRGRSSGTICTHLTHVFLDDLKVHFLHAMVLPLSLKAFLLENFHV